MQVRLQKIIAGTGIASRRKAEEFITQGRVHVNGEVVTQLGAKADPESDSIKVSGRRITIDKGPRLYVMLNKPRACISTTSDPEGRRTVMDLLGPYTGVGGIVSATPNPFSRGLRGLSPYCPSRISKCRCAYPDPVDPLKAITSPRLTGSRFA